MDIDGTSALAEVEYFFRLQFNDIVHSLALVSVFSPPDQETLELSHGTAYICQHGGIDALMVVDITSITAVVAMVPDYQVTVEGEIIIPDNRFSLLEAPFLSLTTLSGAVGEDEDTIDNATETV
jgi:hypothetical protein